MKDRLFEVFNQHLNRKNNLQRSDLIKEVVEKKYAVLSKNGALNSIVDINSTNFNPKDTYLVKYDDETYVDWHSKDNKIIDTKTFDLIMQDGLSFLKEKESIYRIDRVVGSDSTSTFPITVFTDSPYSALFIDTMYREIPSDINRSIFYNDEFTLLVLPFFKIDPKYQDLFNSNMVMAIDFKRKIGLILGSAYMGSIRHTIFTALNYYLPLKGILPMHAAISEGNTGKSAIIVGLDEFKTELNMNLDNRTIISNDEAAWNDFGLYNIENGTYAKITEIDANKNPNIYTIIQNANHQEDGIMIENAMLYPNGKFDFYDTRLTSNIRASIPLSLLTNIKKSLMTNHPATLIFLTIDSYGILPPVSKLNENEALLWYLLGYTTKRDSKTKTFSEIAFSRFFGESSMPLKAEFYLDLLKEKIKKYNPSIYLINTGWIGGNYETGQKIDRETIQKIVQAVVSGDLDLGKFAYDKLFHLSIPNSCPGIPNDILFPFLSWKDKDLYDKFANKLASIFADTFDKNFSKLNISDAIKKSCPRG